MRRLLSVTAAAGLVLLALWGPARPAVAAAPGAGPLVRADRLGPGALPRGAVDRGPEPGGVPVQIEIGLAPSDPAGLAALLRAQYDPSSAQYHQWLTPAQFYARFSPSPSAVQSAEAWLAARGLTAQRRSPFALAVTAPASALSRALGVTLERYRVAGRDGFHALQAPLVPAGLEPEITGILGLDTLNVQRDHHHPARPGATAGEVSAARAHPVAHASGSGPTACPAATNVAYGSNPPAGYTMADEGNDYGIGALLNAGFNGRGQTIGLFELAAYDGDVSTYLACFGLTNSVSSVDVDGGAAPDPSGGGTSEADIDVEEAATQAPSASVVTYNGPDTATGVYDIWNSIVSSDVAKTVSTSWGICEPDNGASNTYTTLFEQAAAQGQSVFAAAGDSGSEDCAADYPNSGWDSLSVDYPASDPYVTAVGGTDLAGGGSPTNPASFEAWNYCNGYPSSVSYPAPGYSGPCFAYYSEAAAGGGGQSSFFSPAAWQSNYFKTHPDPAACGANCRTVPDVAVDAGYPLAGCSPPPPGSSSCWGLGIGTSYAAPFMAALTADRNSGCSQSTGNFAALAYALAASAGPYAQAFTDITTGDNDMTGDHGGSYGAGTGYDLATGLGTPVPAGIACPEVTGITPSQAAPGSKVTVTGLGLEAAQFSFGGTQVTPVSATATSATVVVPAGSGSVRVSASFNGVSGVSTYPFTFDAGGTNPGGQCPASTGENLGSAAGIASVSINGCPGYFVVDAQGRVAAFGAATLHSGPGGQVDMSGVRLAAPVIAIEATPDGQGYWLLGADGGVFTFGDAAFYGSTGGMRLNAPVVGMAATPDNRGYWIVAQDGGVFTFGDARFFGSTGNLHLVKPVDGIAVAPGGNGYWLVAQDGGVFTFTPDGFYGSMGGHPLAAPVVGMSSTPDGRGYTLVGADGGVFNFGDSTFYGSLGGQSLSAPVVDLSPTPADNGYYLVSAAGQVWAFGPGAQNFGDA